MKLPRLVIDDAVPHAAAAFAGLAEVIAAPGSAIDRALLRDAGAALLITRSVTRVDAELLEGTGVRFVASATAGIDHVALADLAARGVAFAHAPGCNADAVVHWVLTALCLAAVRAPARWRPGGVIGIVGYGNVGRRLARRLRALGWPLRVCDPPLHRALEAGDARLDSADQAVRFEPLAALLDGCATLTLHVPLTLPSATDAPTLHLLSRVRWPDAAVINTSRGPVVAADALARAGPGQLILDVWDGEPALPWPRLADDGPVLFASPHVAGYSAQAKLRATLQVRAAVARFLGRASPWEPPPGPPPRPLAPALDGCAGPLDALARCLHDTCPIRQDDRRVRDLRARPPEARAAAFEALRRGYALRDEPPRRLIPARLAARLAPWRDAPVIPGGATLSRALAAVGFTAGSTP